MDRNTYIVSFGGGMTPSKFGTHMPLFSWGQPHFSSNFTKDLVRNDLKRVQIMDRNTYIVSFGGGMTPSMI